MASTPRGAIAAPFAISFIAAGALVAAPADAQFGGKTAPTPTLPAPVTKPAPAPAPVAKPAPAPAPVAEPEPAASHRTDDLAAQLDAPSAVTGPTSTERPSTPSAKRDPGRVRLELGGAYFHATDPHEGNDTRGGVVASVGIRPLAALEITAKYQGSFGSWSYLTTQPSVNGTTNGTFTTT
jgi:outer membrane biosynthesis protein TonB